MPSSAPGHAPSLLRTPVRVLRRVARTPSLRLAVFAILALAAAWAPLGQAGALNDFRDSHLLHSYEEAAVRTTREFGELPLWTPWSCGGLYAWGDPQTRHASPTFLLSLLFGARRAEPLILLLFLLLGMEGAFRWAKERSGSVLGAFLAAPLFGLCGFSALSWSLGWLYFLGFLLLPWVLWGTSLAARGRLAGAALVAGGFAWMLGFGGTYSVPLAAVFVTLEAAVSLASPRPRPPRSRRALALGATALFTLAACAFRLWPIWESLQSGPRVMAGSPANAIGKVAAMVFAFPETGSKAGDGGIFFLGLPFVALALPAIWSRRSLRLASFALLAGWMATGYAARPSPFGLLRELPVFEALRYPERFLFPFALYAAGLAATGVGVLQALARRRHPKARISAQALLVAGLVAVIGWGVQVVAFERLSGRATLVAQPERSEAPFAQSRGNRWMQGHVLALGRGSISCGEGYPVPMSPLLRGDLAQEERFEALSAGTVTRTAWSPQSMVLEVDAREPGRVLVNQNWHPAWSADGARAVNHLGLLALEVPAGRSTVRLDFAPRSAHGGLIVSLLAAVVFAGLAWRRIPLGSVTTALAALVPLIAWAAVVALWHEPSLPPVLTNPDGSPLLVDAPPADATPIGAHFTPDIELVAARVPAHPGSLDEVPMELYWRVTGPVPRTVGIFVHVLGPQNKRKSADHPLIGATWFFKSAPRGVLLRDAFAVSPHDWEAGEWRVTVGLWHASGDGSRLPVVTRDGAGVKDNRLQVGSFEIPARK